MYCIMSRINALKAKSGVAGSGGVRAWLVHHSRFGWIMGGVLGVLSGAVFCNPFFGQFLIQRSYDLPFAFRQPAVASDVVILYMDEESRKELNQAWGQVWDRNIHAQLLDRLRADGSRTVVFDVLFSQQPTPVSGSTNLGPDRATARLAEAMRRHGRVVLASHLQTQGLETLERPDESLVRAAAGIGVAEVLEDTDTVVRCLLLDLPDINGEGNVRTLAWEAARLEGRDPAVGGSLKRGDCWINYYGVPGTIASDSYYRALSLSELPAGYFSNKVVVVGEHYPITVGGARIDTFRSPFPVGRARFPGAEIHATVIQNLLRSEWLRRPLPLVEFALILAVGAAAGAWLPRLKPLFALTICLVLMAGLTALAFEMHWRLRIWWVWMIPVFVQLPVVLVWTILWRALKASMETQFLERSLSLYLSPNTVQVFLRQPELLRPGGQRRCVSILASDITNFSKISSRMDAEDLLGVLNQYYEQVIGAVHATEGTVVKLIGDAIFAIWNAPQEQPDHQDRAARTAILLQNKVVQLNQRLDILPLATRLGLHAGEVCVGNVGSSTHFDYTAVGQNVNLAFRLESFNKQLGTDVLASRDFLKGIAHQLTTRMIGHFRFKGFDGVFEVHEILGSNELAQATQPWRETFARAVHHFHRRSFPAAEAALRETLELRPNDGPSQFLLERISELRGAQLSSDWAGEIDLDQK
jgi:adenylate cyclase